MGALAIDQIIVIANDEMRLARERLEIEESGREVASLQGKIRGFNILLGHMYAELGLTQIAIEDLGDKPLDMRELTDDQLQVLEADVETLQVNPAWLAVLERIGKDDEDSKNFLLLDAEKSRDLDLRQGQHKAEEVYKRLLYQVENEANRRQKEREEKAKNPELFAQRID
jgi:hypothetical protein